MERFYYNHLLSLIVILTLAVPRPGLAEDPLATKLQPFLETHCFDCHDKESKKGNLNLADLKFDPTSQHNQEQWVQVHDRVRAGEMPPKQKSRPDTTEQATFLNSLASPLLAADRARQKNFGRVNVRRLTRREYENTIHDLLGIDMPLQSLLPEDPATHGFETVASGQQLSHFNLAHYLQAADIALDEAFGRAINGDQTFTVKLDADQLGRGGAGKGNYRGPETLDDLAIYWPIRLQFYGRMPATTAPDSGWYQITLKDTHSINGSSPSTWGTLRTGSCYSDEPIMTSIGLVEATTTKRDLVYQAWMEKGHMLELKPNDLTKKTAPTGAQGGNVGYNGRNLTKSGYEGIAVSGIEIQRIYPNAKRWEIRNQLLGGIPKEDASKLLQTNVIPTDVISTAIRQFASRAFRRPVTNDQVQPYIELALKEMKGAGRKPVDGLHTAYRAILCSPRFLTLIEKPGKLDDHAIASRMSYMLWNSMPDKELRELADRNQLSDHRVRHAQVERMLSDPKSDQFIASFTDQWLNLKEIDFTSPDQKLFRTFDSVVQESMVAETRAYVKELIQTDAPITNLVASDFAMLNERLARFYGIKDFTLKPGAGIQRVNLTDSTRGGLLTQGSILKVTANGTTTSPVIRGVYVGERILGIHIPPPPENVPAVEPDIRGAVSIRDQLDKHRNSSSCAACHLKIDPAGFALENFDPVGLWRTAYGSGKNSAKVDPSGVTLEGTPFTNIKEWKAIYSKHPDMLTKAFAKQLITYATGAEPTFADRQDLAKIVTLAQKKNYSTKWILHCVIASDLFLNK